jgi:hypothetical protein
MVALAEGQKPPAGRHDINSLARNSFMVLPLSADFPEELRFRWPGRLGFLINVDLVGGGDEILRELLNSRA